MRRLVIKTNGKINLGLKILGTAENGYHYLESIFIPLPIFDEIVFEESEKFIFNGIFPENNICIKAKNLFYEKSKIDKEISMKLTKKIPIGGGLGGASGNAAGVLSGLNEFFGNIFSQEELLEMAAELGADVPFFIYNTPARVSGFGEKIELLKEFNLPKKIVLFVPKDISCDTKKVYKTFDEMNIYDFSQKNMLQNAAFEAYPELKETFYQLEKEFKGELFLTGSGCCIVGLPDEILGEKFEIIEI